MASNLEHISEELKLLQKEWPETLEILKEAKEEANSGDLFAALEYLSFCDQFCKAIQIGLKKINTYISELKKAKNSTTIADYQELKHTMQAQLDNINDEYKTIAEDTLRRAQDTITKFVHSSHRDANFDLSQNLEQELYLQELRDSLEFYRQEREDYLAELNAVENDSILSQLDTTITGCDNALLIKEIEE